VSFAATTFCKLFVGVSSHDIFLKSGIQIFARNKKTAGHSYRDLLFQLVSVKGNLWICFLWLASTR